MELYKIRPLNVLFSQPSRSIKIQNSLAGKDSVEKNSKFPTHQKSSSHVGDFVSNNDRTGLSKFHIPRAVCFTIVPNTTQFDELVERAVRGWLCKR
jgi:hypothetical protein